MPRCWFFRVIAKYSLKQLLVVFSMENTTYVNFQMIIKWFWIRNVFENNKSIIIPKGGIYVISGAWYFNDIIWVVQFVLDSTPFCPHPKIPCYMHHFVQQIMALIVNSYVHGMICSLSTFLLNGLFTSSSNIFAIIKWSTFTSFSFIIFFTFWILATFCLKLGNIHANILHPLYHSWTLYMYFHLSYFHFQKIRPFSIFTRKCDVKMKKKNEIDVW